MRVAFDIQPKLGSIPIDEVELNTKCRDEIIPIMRALQHIYANSDLCDEILGAIAKDVNGTTSPKLGRQGMPYWQILVLAAVRLGCNFDYDRLQNLAEEHNTLRLIMGLDDWHLDKRDENFSWDRIRDNLCLISPATIERINYAIVAAGHQLAPDAAETVRGDGFVVGANIHYPTDSSLIADGLKNVIKLSVALDEHVGAGGWRQHKYLWRQVKKLKRKIQNVASKKKSGYQKHLEKLYSELLDLASTILIRALALHDQALAMEKAGTADIAVLPLLADLTYFLSITEHCCDIARRRVLEGESIPNREKVFSVYEPDTELIIRGKSPNPIEFGHRVFLIEDAIGFICDYTVLPIGVEERSIVVERMTALQQRVKNKIKRASFDKGFHSPDTQRDISRIVSHPCIPTTGKTPSPQADTVEFRESRKSHPGIESAIGALQSGNGLKRCRDRSPIGYQRYVGLGILGRNLHILGKLLLSREAPKSKAAASKRKRKRR